MAKKMKLVAAITAVLTAVFSVLYCCTSLDFSLTMAITFGTMAYHFIMRLAVGFAIHSLLHNRVDYRLKWFVVSDREMELYKKLGVKKWKNQMPTYDPSAFDKGIHSWDEIAQAMCQAELVHEVIVVLSFVPILAAILFGELAVFLITSILSACFDLMFVMIQRFNRTRIIKLLDKGNVR